MRRRLPLRPVLVLASVGVLSTCGGRSPSSPSTTIQISTGGQVLRVTYQSACSGDVFRTLNPLVYTRVMVTRGNGEWVATAETAAAGDVELRFHEISSAFGFTRVEGTIKGTAIHLPELTTGLPAWDARVNFGNDGRTTLEGFAFTSAAIAPVAGLDGQGTGSITLSDTAGHACGGTAFSWSLFPPA